MLVIIDANVLISILLSSSKKQDLLFSDKIEVVSPDFILFELGRNWKEISEKSNIAEKELELALFLVREQIETYSLKDFSDKMLEAKEICPHKKDVEYFALALKLNCPIWSEEERLKKQNKIKVFSTKELLKMSSKIDSKESESNEESEDE